MTDIEIEVDATSDEPPFEQVRRQIAAGVAGGGLGPGQKLPTVRRLAAELGLAVNTIARAYRELESDGVVVTQGRRGTSVRSEAVDGAGSGTVRHGADDYATTARIHGLSLTEAIRLVESAWSR